MVMKNFKGPGFSMQVPTDWYITSTPEIQAMFISPPYEDGAQANLMVTLNPVEEGVTAQSVADEAKKNQAAQYPEYEVLDEGLVDGTEGKGFQRTYEWFNADKELRVHQHQVMLVVNNMLYVLTTTRPAVAERTEIVKQIDAILQQMLNSFALD
jgi:hypothetical protein